MATIVGRGNGGDEELTTRAIRFVLGILPALTVALECQPAFGQETSASPVPFEECDVAPRDPDAVIEMVDAVIVDGRPPSAADGSIAISHGDNVEVRIDGSIWFAWDGSFVDLTTEASASVDEETAAQIRASLRLLAACGYYPGYLRQYALFTDHGLEQFFRLARQYLSVLEHVFALNSTTTGEERYGTPSVAPVVLDLRRMADGRIAALVQGTLIDGRPDPNPLIYVFKADGGRWLFDWMYAGLSIDRLSAAATPAP